MFDEPFSLFDSALALRTEWQLLLESYQSHAVGLLHACVAPGRLAPGALDRALAEIQKHNYLCAQLAACIASLDDLLEDAQDRQAASYYGPRPGVIHSPPLPGDSGASTSTREPGSEGR